MEDWQVRDRRPAAVAKSYTGVVFTLAAVLVIGGVVAYRFRDRWLAPPAATIPAPAIATPAMAFPVPADEPPEFPVPVVPPVAQEPPLPVLAESDPGLREALAALAGPAPVESFLVPQRLVERLVLTIDSLDGQALPMRLRAVPAIAGGFAAAGPEGAPTIAPANDARYQAFVTALQSVDTQQLVALYVRYYPLFQEAWRALGNPERDFNDRLVQVIDHLLAAPEPAAPVALVRPKVFWQYADPALERLSSGHKAMIRVGPANAVALKTKLREIRAQISALR